MEDLILTSSVAEDDIRYIVQANTLFSKKVMVYNGKCSRPLHKFWVLIEGCRTIDIDNNRILVGLTSRSPTIDRIEDLENKIFERIKNDINIKSNKLTLYNSIKRDDKFVPTIQLIITDSSRFFDHKDERLEYIRADKDFQCIVELDYLMETNNTLALYWRIVQTKELDPIDTNVSLFTRKQAPSVPVRQVYSPPSHDTSNDPPVPRTPVSAPTTLPQKSNAPMRLFITPDEIMKARERLGKKKKVGPEVPQKKVEIKEIPKLRKVETKEPMSASELYMIEREIIQSEKALEKNYMEFLDLQRKIKEHLESDDG